MPSPSKNWGSVAEDEWQYLCLRCALRMVERGTAQKERRSLMTQIELNEREIAQVLAALRNWQTDSLNEDLAEAFAGHFEEHEALTDDEIDALCDRLNFADGQVVKGRPTDSQPQGPSRAPSGACLVVDKG